MRVAPGLQERIAADVGVDAFGDVHIVGAAGGDMGFPGGDARCAVEEDDRCRAACLHLGVACSDDQTAVDVVFAGVYMTDFHE